MYIHTNNNTTLFSISINNTVISKPNNVSYLALFSNISFMLVCFFSCIYINHISRTVKLFYTPSLLDFTGLEICCIM